jgi:3-methyladenine DNA glycosylase/8-oxoguanine DNA glycosylase
MTEFKDALKILKLNDFRLGKVIDLIKPEYNIKKSDEFTSLVKIIIGQQLSGSAARTIVSRVEQCLNEKKFSPKLISSVHQDTLRSCGISNAKISYIRGLSNILLDNPKFFIDLRNNKENKILEKLCKIKGIGIWTASIFTMGTLDYENIFPYGDVSLVKAIRTIYGEKISIEKVISNWSPYKSFGSRILWQWVDKGMPKL